MACASLPLLRADLRQRVTICCYTRMRFAMPLLWIATTRLARKPGKLEVSESTLAVFSTNALFAGGVLVSGDGRSRHVDHFLTPGCECSRMIANARTADGVARVTCNENALRLLDDRPLSECALQVLKPAEALQCDVLEIRIRRC